METTASSPSVPGFRSPAYAAAAIGWAASMVWLGLAHPPMAALAAGSAAYSALLAAFACWRLPPAVPAHSDDTLRLAGPRRAALPRVTIISLALAWALVYGFAYGGAFGGIRVPGLTPLVARVSRLGAPRAGLDGLTLMNFVTIAAVPMVLMLALGTRPRELGLSRTARGTASAMLACLAVPLGFIAWGFVSGALTLALLLAAIVQNLLSNDFTEEFLCRGLALSGLRRSLSNEWSNVIQALLFALFHAGGTVVEERGNPSLIVANIVALNFPMRMTLGVLALRSRSLLLPTTVHVSLHIMKDALG